MSISLAAGGVQTRLQSCLDLGYQKPRERNGSDRRMIFRLTAALGGFLGTIMVAIAIFAFQDNLARFFMKPKTPFQIAATPAPPDYDLPESWLALPDGPGTKLADVFYVHSTTYRSMNFWNAPIDDAESQDELKRIALHNEAGPFARIAHISAPQYRQATKAVYFTHKYDGIAARLRAFKDVSRAFEKFLTQRDPRRPLMLVGYGQGGLHVAGLLRTYFSGTDNALRKELAAAYIIDTPMTADSWRDTPDTLPLCQDQRSIRCVVAYNHFESVFRDEIERDRKRAIIWESNDNLVSTNNPDLVCVNPLDWRVNSVAPSILDHDGAASATGLGLAETPPKIAKSIQASCDRGVLIVPRPDNVFLRHDRWFGRKWHPQPFNLFYHDLSKNAALRVASLSVKRREEDTILEPIDNIVDVPESPIHKVPK